MEVTSSEGLRKTGWAEKRPDAQIWRKTDRTNKLYDRGIIMRRLRNRRVLLLGISFVVLLAMLLVGVLIYNIATSSGGVASLPGDTTADPTPTEAQEPAESTTETEPETTAATEAESETAASTAEDTATDETVADPNETASPEADDDSAAEIAPPEVNPTATPSEAVASPTPRPTATTADSPANEVTLPTATPAQSQQAATTTTIVSYEEGELLTNGGFESVFPQGVARGWTPFQNGSVVAIFSREVEPYIANGRGAQRMTLVNGTQPNRYIGLYQRINTTPNEPHTLALRGHIRSRIGDVTQSNYAYRMQVGFDYAGGTRWERVDNWIELPWDEVPIVGGETSLFDYTTVITPLTGQLTLFIRGWNKWPDQSEAQYTVDSISLTGPIETVRTVAVVASTPAPDAASFAPSSSSSGNNQQVLVDNGLPVTGNMTNLAEDGRLWGGLFLLTLLTVGLGYRYHRRRRVL